MNRKTKWISLSTAIIALIAIMLVSAFPQQQIATASTNNSYAGKQAKYVFFFIGDGLGMPQVNAAEIFKGTLESDNKMHKGKLGFTAFPHQGMQTTHSNNTFITESAAAGTALASGQKTNNDILGMDATKTVKLKTMAEMAKEKGMKIGIVSNVSIDHATPGAFYAHEPTRKNYYEIGLALTNSGYDYFAGGGLLAPTGKNNDKPSVFELAKNNGYKVVNTQEEFNNLSKQSGKVFAIAPELAAEAAMPYDIDRTSRQVTLADFTKKGIELLDNSQGFFMMVEGGKIDWSSHANDAATTVRDVLAFDDAISEALKFYAKHPNETLIVVTGDHETGGMTIGFAGTEYETFFSKINKQDLSFEEFDKKIKNYRETVGAQYANLNDWLPILANDFGLTDLTDYDKTRLNNALAASMVEPKKRTKDPNSSLLYGTYEPFSVTVTHILNQKAGIGWTTYAHTGVAIPVYAQGTGSELFQGYYDNTDIAQKIMNIMGVK